MEHRKADHLEMAFLSQVTGMEHDDRFHYEPLLNPHPISIDLSMEFLGKHLKVPMWVSSMTGGTYAAKKINTNLARVCHEFGMGMGLGSCRILLDEPSHLPDFDMRDIIGDDLPLFANLGIGQTENLLENQGITRLHDMINRLRADGLIIHINPLQEWFQPGGDRIRSAPLDTIKRLLDRLKYPIIVKEVGQGMGPASLHELIRLPIAAIEFAAFGGTNFSKLELMRSEKRAFYAYEPLARVGENALNMVDYVNDILTLESQPGCRQVIISGGISGFLDGYYLIRKINTSAVYGQASAFLRHAKESYNDLHQYVTDQVDGLRLATAYLTLRK